MRRKIDVELKSGIFILVGLIAVAVMVFMISGDNHLFSRQYRIYVKFPDVMGLAVGANIRAGGLKIGRVEDVTFSDTYDSVRVTLLITEKYQQRVRKDSQVRLQTQGVLGDKYVEVVGGTPSAEMATPGTYLEAENTRDFMSVLSESEQVMTLLKDNLANIKTITGAFTKNRQSDTFFHNLTEMSANMKEITTQMRAANTIQEMTGIMKNLRIVSERIKNGEGTIGALLTDPTLYEDLKSVVGGVNRSKVLKFFVRQAVKSSDSAKESDQEGPGSSKKP